MKMSAWTEDRTRAPVLIGEGGLFAERGDVVVVMVLSQEEFARMQFAALNSQSTETPK